MDRTRRRSIAFGPRPDDGDHWHFSRLPTPEESTSSHRSSDDERRNKATRRHSPEHSRSREAGFAGARQPDMFGTSGVHSRIPPSPPYHPADPQRPSLPPIKTIEALASNLNRSPKSPRLQSSSVQPSPQEPAYTPATFKPPSLYPQKKQRTEYLLEPVPPYTSTDTASSPIYEPRQFDRRASRVPTHENPISPHSRRPSVQAISSYGSTASPRLSHRPHQPLFGEPPSTEHSRHYRRGHPSPPERHLPSVRHSIAYDSSPRADFDRPPFERRDSTQAPYDPVYSTFERQRAAAPLHRPTGSSSDEYDSARYRDRQQPEGPVFAQRPPHYAVAGSSHPSFFMPSQYDYRQGRARKRSNLPKQSTEIMKTWFDQNIQNPYPSEDQKAVFSNATGISMTQVSNWFINHRRRCPELRDKRERVRGREGEV